MTKFPSVCPAVRLVGFLQFVVCWLDCFTVPLHNPNGRRLPAVRDVQVDCQWPWKHCKFPPVRIHCDWGHLNLYLAKQIRKGWCLPNGSPVLFPNDISNASRLGLCSSLNIGQRIHNRYHKGRGRTLCPRDGYPSLDLRRGHSGWCRRHRADMSVLILVVV